MFALLALSLGAARVHAQDIGSGLEGQDMPADVPGLWAEITAPTHVNLPEQSVVAEAPRSFEPGTPTMPSQFSSANYSTGESYGAFGTGGITTAGAPAAAAGPAPQISAYGFGGGASPGGYAVEGSDPTGQFTISTREYAENAGNPWAQSSSLPYTGFTGLVTPQDAVMNEEMHLDSGYTNTVLDNFRTSTNVIDRSNQDIPAYDPVFEAATNRSMNNWLSSYLVYDDGRPNSTIGDPLYGPNGPQPTTVRGVVQAVAQSPDFYTLGGGQ